MMDKQQQISLFKIQESKHLTITSWIEKKEGSGFLWLRKKSDGNIEAYKEMEETEHNVEKWINSLHFLPCSWLTAQGKGKLNL